MASDSDILRRLREYAKRRKLDIHEYLGEGIQGIVCSTTLPSAIKAFKDRDAYEREVAVYQRIKERGISSVCGCSVPTPFSHHDGLLVIHMGIVRPPFVLDFASAGLDGPLFEHSPEAISDWIESRMDLFGDRWTTVLKIISVFRSHGIYLSDVKPGNITFE
ncbi:MAG: hypothetical protein NT069_02690 [Planctomycetota bacterium]|nr:hypothetical protein [Planctomycetota bacterium]